MIKSNTVLTGSLQRRYTADKYLAEGGQGWIWLVRDDTGQPLVLKWYFAEQATPDQHASLERLVQSGPPAAPADAEFVWPLDLVTSEDAPGFGYVMPLIDTRRFGDLNDVFSNRTPEPPLATQCRITFLAASSYRVLHASGQCYRDISHGNLLFDSRTGDVRICDNDNVGPYGTTISQVVGTWEYMAPEVATGKADPSAGTDMHSLAVLLFKLWMWHHPLHGLRESSIRSLDDAAHKLLYGDKALFIFDPNDQSNVAADTPEYASVRRRWALCPPTLRHAFMRAFTEGLHNPGRRVTEGEWQRAARAASDAVYSCPSCGAQSALAQGQAGQCWNCRAPIPNFPWLHIKTAVGYLHVPMQASLALHACHLTGNVAEEGEQIAKMSQHPTNPRIWGLTNLTTAPWLARFTDGTISDIAPQRSLPLNGGTEILFFPTDDHGAKALIETS